MRKIEFKNRFYRYILGVDDNNKLFHVCFLPSDSNEEIDVTEWHKRCDQPFPFEVLVNVDFEPLQLSHGVRYFFSQCTARAVFQDLKTVQIPDGEDHIITLLDEKSGLLIHLHYEVYENSPAIRRYTEVENAGNQNITVNHIASFMLCNFPYFGGNCESTFLHSFKSQWSFEGEPRRESFAHLGIYDSGCRNGFTVESTGTWVCQQYFPYFVIEQSDSRLFTAVQNEYSSSWRFEIGAFELGVNNWYYMQGGMGNDMHAHWYKILTPGECFTSPPASITVAKGSIDQVFNNMHLHQEKVLIKRCKTDELMPVIYNDWPFMQADVTEEKILAQLDTLKNCGVDIYVTDAGWFTEENGNGSRSSWWDMAGHWVYDKRRFPRGLSFITQEIKKHGMKAGIWCEIEAVGKESKIYHDKDMLLTRNGEFVSDANRRFLNFTSEKGRRFADEVFDRLVSWGFDYVKIDYNIDSAPGCNGDGAESLGQGLHQNRLAYYFWLENVRQRHPSLMIENCSSGGMRLEYGMLSRTDLASITDQGNFELTGGILYHVSKLIHPSQCGTWSWLEDRFDASQYIFALTNSMAGRMHLSGDFVNQDREKTDILNSSVLFYKKYRHILKNATVYHHSEDFSYHLNNKIRALELRSEDNETSVFCVQRPSCEENGITVSPKGIKDGKYTLEFFPYEEPIHTSGKELRENGIHLSLPHPFCGKVVYIHK